ncbi:MAG: TlpA family protein disulfide reductase [Myxococcales bacterium]|nr:TlpA family protein disulfide reductase [Myxococcales bacterium]MCB9734918.1 TlpA family protein disulfide reductase [Deltaproteobacteria bacterium]
MTFLRWIPTLLLPVMLAAGGCASTGGATGGGGDAGAEASAPPFRATDIDGKSFDLADHLGKDVVVISFWATYCEPCKAEMPVLQRWVDSYGARGLSVVSVSLDTADTVSGVKPYIKKQGYTFTVVVDEDDAISQAYNPSKAAPFMLIVGRDGHVVQRVEGFRPSESDDLEKRIQTLL